MGMGVEEDVDVLLDISYRVHCEDWDHPDFIDDIAVDILAIDDECTEPLVVGHILAQYVDLGRWLNAGTPVRAFDIFDAHSQELADLAPHVIDEDGELIPDVVGGFQDILYMSQMDVDEQWRNRGLGTRALRYLIKTVGRAAGVVVLKPWPVELK
jgi:GNAT superfamily N-acetyltransferase